jgi:hypothetical protein
MIVAYLCGLFASPWACVSGPTHTPDPISDPDSLTDVYKPLSEQCEFAEKLDGEDMTQHVMCPRPTFLQSLLDIRHLEADRDLLSKSLELQAAEFERTVKMDSLDKLELSNHAAVLQAKIDNPWRSPWLWGVIALVVGFGTGFAIGFSK